MLETTVKVRLDEMEPASEVGLKRPRYKSQIQEPTQMKSIVWPNKGKTTPGPPNS
jgi:hypothetical protein